MIPNVPSNTGHRQRTAGDIMSSPVVSVLETDGYKQVVEVLVKHRIGAVPVLSRGGDLLGIVSASDLMLKEELDVPTDIFHPLRHHAQQSKVDKVLACELMTSPVITVTTETGVAAAARTMQKAAVQHLVVVDESGHLRGIVSRIDVLKVFLRDDQEIELEIIDGVLRHDMMIDTGGIGVDVSNGIVTLSGETERASDIRRLGELVLAVDGVVGIRWSLAFRWDDTVVGSVVGPVGSVAGIH
jgi:CBS domain-containing protein